MSKVKIAVVVSTYNGAQYIDEQIKSIYAQHLPESTELAIYIRDDGSTDNTCSLLANYFDANLTVIKGANRGACASFLDALCAVPPSFDYVALCDQDDIWHEDKLSRAISVLSGCRQDVPQLYCSEYIFCDAALNPTGKSKLNKRGVSFEKLLFENVCSGNTMVMNHELHRVVCSLGPNDVYCHDWWIALLTASLGEIHYDRHFYSLDYRRIGENASPTGSNIIKLMRYRFDNFIQGDELYLIKRQLYKLLNSTSPQLDPDKLETLQLFLFGNRFRKAFSKTRLRQTISGEIMLRVLFLFGRL